MERNHRRPPDVEEALSSMLWTPYERTPSDSSSDEDERLNTKLKKSKSSFDYAFPTTHFVPSYRKIERYDNFRFSYPYYGHFPAAPKCITEPPSYESLYQNMTPALSNIIGLSGRLVHSFTDNFIVQNPSAMPPALSITESGFLGDFPDRGPVAAIAIAPCLGEDVDDDDDEESSASKRFNSSNLRISKTSPPGGDSVDAAEEQEMIAAAEPQADDDKSLDPLLGAVDGCGDRELGKEQRQAAVQTITRSGTAAGLPELTRVTKPGREFYSSLGSRDSVLGVALTDGRVGKGKRGAGCARAAQTDHERNIELSLRSIFEESGSTSTIVTETYSDVAGYIDVVESSVSSESGGIRDLAVNVRRKLLAMRLSVPAAPDSVATPGGKGTTTTATCASSATTTSVFLSASSGGDANNGSRRSLITNGTLKGAIVPPPPPLPQQPSLTIQVNQGTDPGLGPPARGVISVVNCFSSAVPHVNAVSNERDVGIVPNVVTATATATAATMTTTTTATATPIPGPAAVFGDIANFSRSSAPGNNTRLRTLERTFTSTESQTDDLHLDQNEVSPSMSGSGLSGPVQSQTEALITREQRRRERRERRQQGRNRHPHILPPPPPPGIRPMLPDILHSHFPPPYTALTLTNPPPPPSSLITPVISTVPIAATAVNDGRFTIPLPVIRRSPSERSGKGCCGQWFAGPPLRALIAVVALGGVACALGGAALGATGLAGPPTSHLTAALLMIGVGVILVTVSGAAWRMTAPGGPPCLGFGSTVDLGRCGRRPCSSRGAPHGLLYPEFQHRPPPPSYQASMQEYRLRLLLLDRDRQNGVVRGGSPPPTYRSHAGSLLRTPLSTTSRGGGGNGSSIGGPGSEYSLPPSYRSRNTGNSSSNNNNSSRPPTVFGDESMESLGSNNFNILSSRGNVPEDDSIQSTTMTRTRTSPEHPSVESLNEAEIIADEAQPTTKDRDATVNGGSLAVRSQNLNEKITPRVLSSDNLSCNKRSPSSKGPSRGEQSAAPGRKELITIVTISASRGPDESQSEMDILAHL